MCLHYLESRMSDLESNYSDNEQSEQSQSESDDEVDKKKKTRRKKTPEDNTESYSCIPCGQKFATQHIAYNHTRTCKKKLISKLNKCMWCGLEFKNRGNLASHAFHIHGDSSYKSLSTVNQPVHTCTVCNKSFKMQVYLRYHIRTHHFNLQARVPYAELKNVNQVWFEKVLNSNKIMEIKKTGSNKLIMRTLDEHTGMKVNDVETKTVDLRHLYPTEKNLRGTCDYCKQSYLRKDLKKHIEERHLNLKKFSCNNCKRSFKRAYQYLQHHCNKHQKLRGVRHCRDTNSGIRIADVEGFSMPLG